MKDIVLGIGDLGVTATAGTAIKTYALGSCVAIIFLDPKTRCVGMAHVALPDSGINPEMRRKRIGYFADSAIPALLEAMVQAGTHPSARGVMTKLVGGATIMDNNQTFNIGKRNLLAIKKILWTRGMGALAEDTGGNFSRTVSVPVDTGEVIISCPGRGQWKI
jgi:chemotaxis protein CheD